MALQPIVLMGTSGHARLVIDIVQCEGRYEVVGLLDSFKPVGSVELGLPVLGDETAIPALMAERGVIGGIIAIGDNYVRSRMTARVKEIAPDFEFVLAVHPSATIARDSVLGPGTIVMAAVVVNPNTRVGEGCSLATNSSLDHDNTLGDFSSIAPTVATGGGVQIGSLTALGMGAVTKHGIKIGSNCVVGGGSFVNRDIPDNTVAYGVPARVIRTRELGEKYL